MHISTIEIQNFLSFVGNCKVTLKQFTAVMYSNQIAKDNFLKAIKFVIGAKLEELDVFQYEELYDDCLLPAGSILSYPELYVKAEIVIRNENLNVAIYRGCSSREVVYRINDSIVSEQNYRFAIKAMCCGKTFLPFDSLINAMWESEGIEQELEMLSGLNFKRADLKLVIKELQLAAAAYAMEKEKRLLLLMRDQRTVNEIVEEFEALRHEREKKKNLFLKSLATDEEEADSSEEIPTQATQSENASNELHVLLEDEKNIERALEIEEREEARLIASLAYIEQRLAKDELSFIQRRKALKVNIESQMEQSKRVLSEIRLELEVTSQEISMDLAELEDTVGSVKYKRLTAYGRLIDLLKPGRYLWLLQAVIPQEILYGHLLDNRESAMKFLKVLRERHVGARISFVVLTNYPPQLKEYIFSDDICKPMQDVYDVLKLLLKLKEFGLISHVPSLINNGEFVLEDQDFENLVFLSTGEFVQDDGLFGRYQIGNPDDRLVADALTNVNCLLRHQDMLFDHARRIEVHLDKMRREVTWINDDISSIRNWPHSRPQPTFAPSALPFVVPQIYEEFASIFESYKEQLLESESESQKYRFEPIHTPYVLNRPGLELDLSNYKDALKSAKERKSLLGEHLKIRRDEIRANLMESLKVRFVVGKPFILPQPVKDRSKIALNLRIKALRSIIRKDEFELLKGSNEWRTEVLNRRRSEALEAKRRSIYCQIEVDQVRQRRQTLLQPIQELCARNVATLFEMFRGCPLESANLIDYDDLPLQLCLDSRDIFDFDVFTRCLACLALFIQAVRLRGGFLFMIDDLEQLFPRSDLDAANLDDKEEDFQHYRFRLLTRIGDALKNVLTKGTTNDSGLEGDVPDLEQILMFTTSDVIRSADHHIVLFKETMTDPRDGQSQRDIFRFADMCCLNSVAVSIS